MPVGFDETVLDSAPKDKGDNSAAMADPGSILDAAFVAEGWAGAAGTTAGAGATGGGG